MRQQFLTVDGQRVSLHTAGRPDRKAVVLLHGGGLAGDTWRPVSDALEHDYAVFAPDLRGHGDTDWSPAGAYSLADHATDLRMLMDRLDIVDPHLVGMSLGGQIALHAVCHGMPVSSLTLVDILPRTMPDAGRSLARFNESLVFPTLDAAVEHAVTFSPNRTAESLRASLSRRLRQRDDGAWIWKWDPRRLSSHEHRREEAAGLSPLVGRIDAPVLVIRGADSAVISDELAAEFAETLARHGIPSGVVTVANAGHGVHSDQPALVTELLKRLFSTGDPPSRL